MNPFDDSIGALARQANEFDRLREAMLDQSTDALSWATGSNTDLIRQMDQSFMRTRMDEISVIRTALENASSPLIENMGAIQSAAEELEFYNKRFRSPVEEEIRRINNSFAGMGSVNALGLAPECISEISKSLAGIQSHWVDSQNVSQSLTAASELYAISAGITDLKPFGGALTNVFRSDFGDWRHIKTIPESILTSPVERFGFYRYHGFDDSLTDFPTEAFNDLLLHSGIHRSTWPTPAPDYGNGLTIEAENEENNVPERNRTAYKVIFRLETRLRKFVDEEMTRKFGAGWEKQRTPGNMYSEWKEKKKAAIKAGDGDHPLITYADFTDYLPIIERNDNWNHVFKSVFIRKTDIQESLVRLQPVRICTMHCRTITADDQLLLGAEAQRIFRALEL